MHPEHPSRLFATVLLLALSLAPFVCADTTTVQFSGRDYQIPIPEGFELVPPEGEKFQRLLIGSLGTNGVLLTTLVSAEEARQLRAGTVIAAERTLIVVGDRGRMKDLQTDQEFMLIKGIMLKKQSEMAKTLGDSMRRSEGKANDLVSQELKVDTGFKIGNTTLYPTHDQSSRHWSSTMSIEMELTNELGRREKATNVTTMTYLFFRPGVLQLAVSDIGGDFAWTRRACQEWMEMVAAANPLPALSLARASVAAPDPSEKMLNDLDSLYSDTAKWFGKLIAMFIIVALVGIAGRIIKRAHNRKSNPPP